MDTLSVCSRAVFFLIYVVSINMLWKFLWVLGHARRHFPPTPRVFTSFDKVLLPAWVSPHKPHGDGSRAPSHPGLNLDGSHVPFGSTAAHDPAGSLILWVEVEVPDETMKNDWDEHPGTNGST